jgi:hypothetical protein
MDYIHLYINSDMLRTEILPGTRQKSDIEQIMAQCSFT